VGAIGQLGTFPPGSTDTAAITAELTPEGFFIPRFPGLADSVPQPSPSPVPGAARVADCCAPGVAIIAGLPPSSYGPLSGTGIAAAHVTALAALILAHHPVFRTEPDLPRAARDFTRPARLLEIIRDSCRPLPRLDPARAGAGLPDAAVALSVAPWGAYPPLSLPYPAPTPAPDGRTSLEPLNATMHAAGLL
jgi:subtilisin family serine protease